jgi:uncharacterized alkaline shock family protein YloU
VSHQPPAHISSGHDLATQASPPRPLELADHVAAVVRAVPGVADLHSGTFGEVATHFPGRRVKGVQIRTDHCSIHVVLYWGAPVLETADRVRAAVAALVSTRIDVTIEDIVQLLPTA